MSPKRSSPKRSGPRRPAAPKRSAAAPIISPQVSEYLEKLVPSRPPELALMERVARKTNFPIIGPAVGQLCYLLARAIGARRVFELGSGYGYSTAWFARAVKENGGGVVHHVVWDQDLSRRARAHLDALELGDQVHYTVGEAVDTLRKTGEQFDIIFNDIDKRAYPDSLPVIESRLRSGGLLITDNLLWSGRIFDAADKSEDTKGVRKLTRLVTDSPVWSASIIPIRDGVLVARKA
ncbi:MAG TPA: O-methyltransferase [Gemmatimonadaceae bacterium]|nr:O-methyltransferase [Gemmatimonadaceae bacterium]